MVFENASLLSPQKNSTPNTFLLEFVQDKCDLLNSFSENDRVKIGINIRGREWQSPQGETKFFNSIQGWRIDSLEQSGTPEPPPPPFDPAENTTTEAPDDLPF